MSDLAIRVNSMRPYLRPLLVVYHNERHNDEMNITNTMNTKERERGSAGVHFMIDMQFLHVSLLFVYCTIECVAPIHSDPNLKSFYTPKVIQNPTSSTTSFTLYSLLGAQAQS